MADITYDQIVNQVATDLHDNAAQALTETHVPEVNKVEVSIEGRTVFNEEILEMQELKNNL